MYRESIARHQHVSVHNVVDRLRSLQLTSAGLASYDDSEKNNAAETPSDIDLRIVEELRRALGRDLPFEANGSHIESSRNYYVLNSYLINRLERCSNYAVGNYYSSQEASMPEGRHFILSQLIRETTACARLMGWDIDQIHITDLFSSQATPANDRESFIKRFLNFMMRGDITELTPQKIMTLHDQLYSDAHRISSAFDEASNSDYCQYVLKILCDLVTDETESSHPPFLKPFIALEAMLILRPFSSGNVFMARLLFSLAMQLEGYPLAISLPVVDFLTTWSTSANFEKDEYVPRESAENVIVHHGRFVDWSLWFEEVLGFASAELNRFVNKLYCMSMRRDRLKDLLACVSSLNARQRELLLEAILHVDAEFTYQSVINQFGVAYGTAYSDLGSLKDAGFLTSTLSGTTAVFTANDTIASRIHELFRREAPEQYGHFYTQDGNFTNEYLEKRDQTLNLMRHNRLISNVAVFELPIYNREATTLLASKFSNAQHMPHCP